MITFTYTFVKDSSNVLLYGCEIWTLKNNKDEQIGGVRAVVPPPNSEDFADNTYYQRRST